MESPVIGDTAVQTTGTLPAERSMAEPASWAALYEQHGRYVYYLALRMLGDPAQAEDATHDVFLKAFRNLDEFRGRSKVRTWLYRITINHCQNLSRTWYRRNVFAEESGRTMEAIAAKWDSPLRVLELKELGQRIQTTLDALPEEYKLLLLLVADEDLSYQEVAGLTEQTADAVRGKLYRARKAFVVEFQKHG